MLFETKVNSNIEPVILLEVKKSGRIKIVATLFSPSFGGNLIQRSTLTWNRLGLIHVSGHLFLSHRAAVFDNV